MAASLQSPFVTLAVVAGLFAAVCSGSSGIYQTDPIPTSGQLSILQDNEASYGYVTTYDFNTVFSVVGDKFVVPEGETWQVENLDLFLYVENAGEEVPIYGVSWAIFDAMPHPTIQPIVNSQSPLLDGGIVGYRVSQSDQSSTSRAIHRVQLASFPGNVVLSSGTYYLAWVFYAPAPVVVYTPPTNSLNEGNAILANIVGDNLFHPIVDEGNGRKPSLPFTLYGTVTYDTTTTTTTTTETTTTTTTTVTTTTTAAPLVCNPIGPCDPNVANQKLANIRQTLDNYFASSSNGNPGNNRRRSLPSARPLPKLNLANLTVEN